jgi:hypothetical protein
MPTRNVCTLSNIRVASNTHCFAAANALRRTVQVYLERQLSGGQTQTANYRSWPPAARGSAGPRVRGSAKNTSERVHHFGPWQTASTLCPSGSKTNAP